MPDIRFVRVIIVKDNRIPINVRSHYNLWKSIHFMIGGWAEWELWQTGSNTQRDDSAIGCKNALSTTNAKGAIIDMIAKMFHLSAGMNRTLCRVMSMLMKNAK